RRKKSDGEYAFRYGGQPIGDFHGSNSSTAILNSLCGAKSAISFSATGHKFNRIAGFDVLVRERTRQRCYPYFKT
ncbi:MAG: hypothetical protein WBW41_14650, partial [Verrucomicrobiia bacterium]